MGTENNFNFEDAFQAMFNSKSIGILISNRSGVILNANDFFLNLLGYCRKDLESENLTWMKLTAPESMAISNIAAKELAKGPMTQSFEKEYLHKNGTRIPVRLSATNINNDMNIVVVLDITSQKEKEKALEETRRLQNENQLLELKSEQIARETAEQRARQMAFLSELSWALNQSFDLAKNLKAFAEKTVSYLADILVVEIIDPKDMKNIFTYVSAKNEEDKKFIEAWKKNNPMNWNSPIGSPHVYKTKKAQIFSFEDTAQQLQKLFSSEIKKEDLRLSLRSVMDIPILQRDLEPLGVITFLSKDRDFTPDELQFAIDITNRLAITIENCKLYEKTQSANKAKTSFLANVSHEIRTPLGAMIGYAEVLFEDENLKPEYRETAKTISNNGIQLLRLVDEILDISKVESEKIQIESIPFNLVNLLEDAIHLMKLKAKEKGLALSAKFENIPQFVESDPTRLRQILINIIDNAIKFTDAGTIEVKVKKEKNLVIQIKDTGIGITEEEQTHLFQPFIQADSSTTRRFGGTGLGLYLAKKLAYLLGGDVFLEKSERGKGSTFVISIAVKECAQSVSASSSLKEDSESISPNLKVLIVDDVQDNRELFFRFLTKIGIDSKCIRTAKDGFEALEQAQQQEPDIILMDIQMPRMDGFEALRMLRKKSYPGKVIALTAHAMQGDREHFLTSGFDDYLQKPISKKSLTQILHK